MKDGWFSTVTIHNHSAAIMHDLIVEFEKVSLKNSDRMDTTDAVHTVESTIHSRSKMDLRDKFTMEWVDRTP